MYRNRPSRLTGAVLPAAAPDRRRHAHGGILKRVDERQRQRAAGAARKRIGRERAARCVDAAGVYLRRACVNPARSLLLI